MDQAQQLHLRAALLNQVLVEQEQLIGLQQKKTTDFTAANGDVLKAQSDTASSLDIVTSFIDTISS